MADGAQPREHRLTQADWGVLAAFIATAVFVAVVILRAPRVVGALEDDGVYLVTGKALAEGRGYRHLELPGEPCQTKYPILYPLLLSVIWRVAPDFPGNVPVIQLVNIALWTAGTWLAYRAMRRVWGWPCWLPACGAIMAFVHPTVLGLLQTAMAEALYLFLSLATLALATSNRAESAVDGHGHPGLIRAALCGLLASAAYLARSIGVTLIAALLGDLLLRRRWKRAAAAALVTGLAVGGWQAWRVHAGAANVTNPAAAAFRYDLEYSAWLPSSVRELSWVAYHNVSDLSLGYLLLLLPPPPDWATRMVQRGLVGGLPLYLGVLTTLALTVAGLAAAWKRSRSAIHLYLAAYVALVLIWPFEPARFLVPVLPLLATLTLSGLYLFVVRLAGMLRRRPWRTAERGSDPAASEARWSPARPGGRAGRVVTVLVALALALPCLRLDATLPNRPYLEDWQHQRQALAELLRAQTPPDAVISSVGAGYLHLRTGRKLVPFLPWDNSIPHYYPADRRFLECGRVITKGERAAGLHLMETCLPEYLRRAGVSHLVPPAQRTTRGADFEEFRRKHPQNFQRLRSAGPHTLYRVVLPER